MSSSGSQPKKTKDASFQIGGKSVKPKMFVKRPQVKPSTREYVIQTLVLKRTIGTQYDKQTLEEDKTDKMDWIEEEHGD